MGRFKHVIFAINGGRASGVLLEEINLHLPWFRVNEPEFLDSDTGIDPQLCIAVEVSVTGRKDLHYEIRRAFDPRIRQHPIILSSYKYDIRLENVMLGQINIKRC